MNRFEVLVTSRLHLPLSLFPLEVLHFVPHTLKGVIFEDELEGWGACKQFLDLVISWAFLIRLKSVQDGVSVLLTPVFASGRLRENGLRRSKDKSLCSFSSVFCRSIWGSTIVKQEKVGS